MPKYCLIQEKLRASMESEVSQGNEPFKTLPSKGYTVEEIKARLQRKVRGLSTKGRPDVCLAACIKSQELLDS